MSYFFKSKRYGHRQDGASNSRRITGALQSVFTQLFNQRGTAHAQSLGGLCHHTVGVVQSLPDITDLKVAEVLFKIQPATGQAGFRLKLVLHRLG